MSTPRDTKQTGACEFAKKRLLAISGDPLVFADWGQVVFLHFLVPAERLRPDVPAPFELELYEGSACVSLVALTMRRFRPCRSISPAWLLAPVVRQRFLNLRTYVRCQGEPGALFLHGWLSKPLPIPLPSGRFELPYSFASLDYAHELETGMLKGVVSRNGGDGQFAYCAPITPNAPFQPCVPGSLAEFALERYAGFFCRHQQAYVFRAWHPAWLQTPIEPCIEDSLVRVRFPWLDGAKLAGGNFAPGFERVWLGRAHRIDEADKARRSHRLSAFYKMP
jgi:uncharacterized protein YqjF (DUF2071 family)